MEKNNNSKQIILSVLGVAILIVAVVGISFAAFTFTGTGQVANTISTGTISMSYSEDTNGISITNAMPMTDEVGKTLDGENETFTFTVSAAISGNATINYEIAAIKDETSTLADTDVKLYLTKGEAETTVFGPSNFIPSAQESALGAPAGSMILTSGSYTAASTIDTYKLRMWVADTAVMGETSKSYTVRINVYGAAA